MKNYYLLLTSIIFICGVLLASLGIFEHISPGFLIISIIILFVLLLLSLKRDALFVAILLVLTFLLGAVRYSVFNITQKDHIRNFTPYTPRKVFIEGKAISDIETSRSGRKQTFVLEADSIELEDRWRRTNGLVLINVYGRKVFPYRYGNIIVLEGCLQRPFSYYSRQSNFDYRKYLANKRIYSVLNVKKEFLLKAVGEDEKNTTQIMRIIYSVRAKLASHIETYLDAPYNSVLTAILLGKRKKIPPGLKDLFAKTGTLHILAISGLHVGIIYFALRVILKIFRVHRNLSIILSVLFLVCFTILTGARPSILRATTMFCILAFGETLKRKISAFNLIGLSCLIILMANPNQIFDIGFILSYVAVLSIVGVSPYFYQIFSVKGSLGRTDAMVRKIKYYLLRSISVSLAVWIGLAPLIAYYFNLVSFVVVIANLVVIPLLFMVMGSGLLFVSLGLLSKFLATIFAQSTWFFLFVLINSVKFLKNIPFGYFKINSPHRWSLILYYAALFIALKTWERYRPLSA